MRRKRGGALLAVLWLSAALSAIALAVSLSVRSEIARAQTGWEGVQAHYLAQGAIDRALLYLMMGPGERRPDGRARFHDPDIPFLKLFFPAGEAVVEIIPESSKLPVNTVNPAELLRLLAALEVAPEAAGAITAAIVDWRSPVATVGPFDAYYLSRNPSFLPRHASMEEIEELLMVRGVTPDLFYGRYDQALDGTLAPRSGLRDCLTTYGTDQGIDINIADPAVLLAIGVPPQGVEAVIALRAKGPILPAAMPALGSIVGPAMGRLRQGGGDTLTLRATARLNMPDGRLSDLRRTASAVIRSNRYGSREPYTILRWRSHEPVERLTWDVWSR